MTRSRSFNRSNRLNAKRRRSALRSLIPNLQDDSRKLPKPIDHSQNLIIRATDKEALVDLMDP